MLWSTSIQPRVSSRGEATLPCPGYAQPHGSTRKLVEASLADGDNLRERWRD
jgi:hypothetical protein